VSHVASVLAPNRVPQRVLSLPHLDTLFPVWSTKSDMRLEIEIQCVETITPRRWRVPDAYSNPSSVSIAACALPSVSDAEQRCLHRADDYAVVISSGVVCWSPFRRGTAFRRDIRSPALKN
jgi:hypothetical protein